MKNVVFDLDGTLVDLHSPLVNRVKCDYPLFDMNRVLTYDFNKSLDFTKVSESFLETEKFSDMRDIYFGLNAPRSLMFSHLSDLSLFEEARYYDGVIEGLVGLSKVCNIIFHSLAFTKEIAHYKSEMIYRDFGQLFDFTVVTTVGKSKPALIGMDYVVEDNIFDLDDYVGNSDAELLLIDKPYNSELYNSNASPILAKCKRAENIKICIEYLKISCKKESM